MTKIIYPHRLRAIRVREDMVLITAKNAPVGAFLFYSGFFSAFSWSTTISG